jgi:DNA repair protein RecO
MPTISDTAICLRTWDFSETSQTVSLLTREYGVVRGLAKGAKRDSGSFSGGFDPLTAGHIVAILKQGRDLATLTEWALEWVCWSARSDLSSNKAALYVADLAQRMLQDHDPHPDVFDCVHGALLALGETSPGAVLLHYQWQMLVAGGYRPQLHTDVLTGGPLEEDQEAMGFSLAGGGTVADTGGIDRVRVRMETVALLRHLDGGGVVGDDRPVAVVDRANRLLAVYLRFVLGGESSAMRWAFSDLPGPETLAGRTT